MKIDSSIKTLGGLAGPTGKDSPKSANVPPKAGARQSAEVELSPLSARLQETEGSRGVDSVVDSDRVAAIRAAISAGTFKIDTGRIADGLIDSVRQMLAAQK